MSIAHEQRMPKKDRVIIRVNGSYRLGCEIDHTYYNKYILCDMGEEYST